MVIYWFFLLMIRPTPRSTRTDTLFPSTPLFRSLRVIIIVEIGPDGPAFAALRLHPFGPVLQPFAGIAAAIFALRAVEADIGGRADGQPGTRSEEHTSELQSLMRTSYAVFCWKQKSIYNVDTDKRIPIHYRQ